MYSTEAVWECGVRWMDAAAGDRSSGWLTRHVGTTDRLERSPSTNRPPQFASITD